MTAYRFTARLTYHYGQCCMTPSDAIAVAAANGIKLHQPNPYHKDLCDDKGQSVRWEPYRMCGADGQTALFTVSFWFSRP